MIINEITKVGVGFGSNWILELNPKLKKIQFGFHPAGKEISDPKEVIKLIQTNCQNFLKIYQKYGPLYRGIQQRSIPSAFVASSIKSNRKPMSLDIGLQFIIDKKLKEAGFKALRSNSIFCTSSYRIAKSYSNGASEQIYQIFPIDGFDYTWSESISDFYVSMDESKLIRDIEELTPQEFVKKYNFKNTDLGSSYNSPLASPEIYIHGKYIAVSEIFNSEHEISFYLKEKKMSESARSYGGFKIPSDFNYQPKGQKLVDLDKVINNIQKNCSEFLRIYKTVGPLYRGIEPNVQSSKPMIFKAGTLKANRIPMNMSPKDQLIIDEKLKKMGFKAVRGNSIFCSGDRQVAGSYGYSEGVYQIFPFNGFNFTWGETRDFYDDTSTDELEYMLKYLSPAQFVYRFKFRKDNLEEAIKHGYEIYISGRYIAVNDLLIKNNKEFGKLK